MINLNRAMIIGNLTKDPEMRYTPSGQPVTTITVATNRSWVDSSGQRQEQTEFHDVVAWGKLAEICSQILAKGRKAYVEGRLQTRSWEGQDGIKRYKTEIIADNIIALDRLGGAEHKGFEDHGSQAAPAASTPETDIAPTPAGNSTEEINIDEIPF